MTSNNKTITAKLVREEWQTVSLMTLLTEQVCVVFFCDLIYMESACPTVVNVSLLMHNASMFVTSALRDKILGRISIVQYCMSVAGARYYTRNLSQRRYTQRWPALSWRSTSGG